MKKWLESEFRTAIDLLDKGYSHEAIAHELKKTKRAVSVFLSKKGISTLALKKEKRKCCICGNEFEASSTGGRVTCSETCLEQYSNQKRSGPKRKAKGNCHFCNKAIQERHAKKFCNIQCSASHKQRLKFEKIEQGDVSLPTPMVKKYLIHKHGNRCMQCGWAQVNPKSGIIPIQIDHIDGNSDNNVLSNVRLLCPNCHSLTPTFCSLNTNGSKSKRANHYYRYRHRDVA